MPIPTKFDHDLSAVDDLHNVTMTRLRTLRRAGARRDAAGVRQALDQYMAAVQALVKDCCQ